MYLNSSIFRILLGLSLLASLGSLRAQPLNTLSAQEKKDGWQLLFNGRTTAGWHTYGGKGVGSAWKVEQGALHLDVPVRAGNKAPNGGDLVTDAEIKGDFEVKIEWKVGHLTNSGIFFFVQEQPSYKNVYDTGLELQLEDEAILAGVSEDKQQGHRSGDFFSLAVARVRELAPTGEWNQLRVVLKKNQLTVSMNGYSIQEHDLSNAAWKQLVAMSKLKNAPLARGVFSGRIGLQDWGSTVWFRNIKLRKL